MLLTSNLQPKKAAPFKPWDKRLNFCVIKDYAQASCFALLYDALLMKTVNYWVIKTMSKARPLARWFG